MNIQRFFEERSSLISSATVLLTRWSYIRIKPYRTKNRSTLFVHVCRVCV